MQLHHGDCLDVMATMEADSVDTIITDPPYGLEFMGKDWDKFGATNEVASEGADKSHPFRDGTKRIRYGYGPKASYSFQSFMTDVFTKALRVAKPGAMLLAFGGTRTFHRLACAIEDAGWELRDTMSWLYGSGFPKSHNIGKALNGNGADWHGWGTALKPAWEPIIVAMKPLDGTFAANALAHGVAGLWIDGGRVGTRTENESGWSKSGSKASNNRAMSGPNYERPPKDEAGTGRWPANLIHDGSDEVTGLFPVTKNGGQNKTSVKGRGMFMNGSEAGTSSYPGDTGSAARFFYCAKASRSERNAGLEGMEAVKVNDGRQTPIDNAYQRGETLRVNTHPTVKPIALMRYLARLTKTPSGGVVLDPFMGSGSTGIGAVLEGREFIGIEQDADYIEIARRRIEHWAGQPRQEELI